MARSYKYIAGLDEPRASEIKMASGLENISHCFEFVSEDLTRYLSTDKKRNTTVLSLLKQVFEYNKKDEMMSGRLIESCPLVEFIASEDCEQVWQQIQLQNDTILVETDARIKQLVKKKGDILLQELNNNNNDDQLDDHNDDFLDEDIDEAIKIDEAIDDDDRSDQSDIDRTKNNDLTIHGSKHTNNIKGSIVDDQFFKLSEMEKFLEMQDKHAEMKDDDDDGIDFFIDYNNVINQDNNDDISKLSPSEREDPTHYMYEDFFDNPPDEEKCREQSMKNISRVSQRKEQMREDSSDSGLQGLDEVGADKEQLGDKDHKLDDVNKSTFEKQQEKVNKRIAQLEDSNVAAKPWQLVGETSASLRPANSLLEEMLYFDHTTDPTPVMTEEATLGLEDIIKQRIKDQTWDDVERKEKPVKEPYVYVKNKSVNQEKSKMSLSEIYEKEYLAQQEPISEKPNEAHAEIEKMMTALFSKLDALSNFHFTPKPLKPEVNIVANVGSVTIEESIPVTVSETNLLAPEEIFDKQKTEVKGETEKTKEDRKQERRLKKKRQHLSAKKKGEGNKLGIKAKRMKKGHNEDKKTVTSSSVFFAKLQDSVRMKINEKKVTTKKKNNTVQSSQVKL